ncbi:MAG: hypothetical protein IPP71_06965 [Bacteroidetes bacterium]|nr:hypothetical protein [Bacteroidota bacterium]
MANQQDFTLFVIVIALSFLIMSAFLIGIILNIYRQRVVNQKNILNEIYKAQENEKTRISENLHDDLGGSLSALRFIIDEIQEESADSTSVISAKEGIKLLDSIIGDLRNIIRNQSSKYLLLNGFKFELERFSNHIAQNKKIKFDFKISQQLPSLNNNFGINLYRIIQELINNSIQHSSCSVISLELIATGIKMELNYADNGSGFDPNDAAHSGLGIPNINARIRLYNGKCEVHSAIGKPTSYQLLFDIKEII